MAASLLPGTTAYVAVHGCRSGALARPPLGKLTGSLGVHNCSLLTVQVASHGETSTAVTLLTKYVSLYVNDLEAWEELAAMYLQVRKGLPGSR